MYFIIIYILLGSICRKKSVCFFIHFYPAAELVWIAYFYINKYILSYMRLNTAYSETNVWDII